jgi:hypothetical protein
MEICKHVPPTYREVEEGHFCACHLYASEEELAKFALQQAQEEQLAQETASV